MMFFIILFVIVFTVMIAAFISSRKVQDEQSLDYLLIEAWKRYEECLHKFEEIPSQANLDCVKRAKEEYERLLSKKK